MRTTRIEIQGREGHYATISRLYEPRPCRFIRVDILCPGLDRTHRVSADDRDDQWSMAECLQETLDGYRGTNGDIDEYFRTLQTFAD
ncbi:MAG: hypothetical protein KAS72_12955 [Phycisphaerales bacterium]|nr:hypothetical protein [Phycisphaerales bacterium]